MMLSLKSYMGKMQSLVDKALDKFLPKEKEEPRIIHRAMRYSVFSGGKRIRPILTLEAFKACSEPGLSRGAGHAKNAIATACALEFVHTYSLLHDDLPSMDDDDYRRGHPTCHMVFGEANAILAGDALLTLAFNILSKSLKPKRGMAAVRELSDAAGTFGMVGGQVVDIQSRSSDMDVKTINYINGLKTARLFEASTKLGAIAAGSDTRKIKAMAAFGASVGRAFQILDDVIDKEGYAKLFGIMKSCRDAESLIEKAKSALDPFGKKADVLSDIADYLLTRQN